MNKRKKLVRNKTNVFLRKKFHLSSLLWFVINKVEAMIKIPVSQLVWFARLRVRCLKMKLNKKISDLFSDMNMLVSGQYRIANEKFNRVSGCQHNDTQNNNKNATLSIQCRYAVSHFIAMLNVVLPSVVASHQTSLVLEKVNVLFDQMLWRHFVLTPRK